MITLTSDFGAPYPAVMKGVLLSRTEAQLVDIAHDLPRQDVRTAAFWLRETIPFFPPAVHLAVVDPGVGTDRRALVIRVGEHALVGPDNGLLRPVVRRLVAQSSDGEAVTTFEITVDSPASATFHGRDVFAPAAAAVHEHGIEHIAAVDELSPLSLADCVDLRFPEPTSEENTIHGEILVVDDFGNLITNIPGGWLADGETAIVNDESVPIAETFATVEPGSRLLTVGSHGYVECDVNQGRGDDAFGLAAGDQITLVRPNTKSDYP